MTTPAFVAANHNTSDSGTTFSVTVPDAGAGAAAGDFAVIIATLTPGTIATPSGWTLHGSFPTTATASNGKMYLWSKTLEAGDLGASVTLNPDSSSRCAAVCMVTDPASIDVLAKDETNTSGTAVTAPSVDPTATDGLLVCAGGSIGNTSGATVTWSGPGSMTERKDICSTSATVRNATIGLYTEALSSGDATGTRALTASANVQRQAVSFVLAGAGGTTTERTFTGSITPAGALTRQTQKPLAGTVTPAGALAAVRVILLSLAGTVTSAGTLTRQALKALAGTVTPTGTATRSTARTLAGTTTPTGVLTKTTAKPLAGETASAGALTRQVGKALAGAVTPTGALTKTLARTLSAAVAIAGVLVKQLGRTFSGSAASAGAVSTVHTPAGAAPRNATSAAAVTARRTSTAATVARRTSTSSVSDG